MKIFLMYLKERIVNNKSIIFILISVFIFIFCFLTIKNSYFNEIINYMETYINYYVAKYLQGDYTSLIVSSNMPLSIFVENDVVGILSAPYLYCFMHSNTIFSIYLFVLPFIIFKYIFKVIKLCLKFIHKNNSVLSYVLCQLVIAVKAFEKHRVNFIERVNIL